jgi:hypothetical protein
VPVLFIVAIADRQKFSAVSGWAYFDSKRPVSDSTDSRTWIAQEALHIVVACGRGNLLTCCSRPGDDVLIDIQPEPIGSSQEIVTTR